MTATAQVARGMVRGMGKLRDGDPRGAAPASPPPVFAGPMPPAS